MLEKTQSFDRSVWADKLKKSARNITVLSKMAMRTRWKDRLTANRVIDLISRHTIKFSNMKIQGAMSSRDQKAVLKMSEDAIKYIESHFNDK